MDHYLKQRLQDDLLGKNLPHKEHCQIKQSPTVPTHCTCGASDPRSVDDFVSHVAADVEGLLPKAKDQNNPKLESWEMHQAIGFNDALTVVDTALARYMKGDDEKID
jgi:hypothetical protein